MRLDTHKMSVIITNTRKMSILGGVFLRNNLRTARLKNGMTQYAAAHAVGISWRYFQEIEAGRREGKTALWDKLEDLFRVPQRELRRNV